MIISSSCCWSQVNAFQLCRNVEALHPAVSVSRKSSTRTLLKSPPTYPLLIQQLCFSPPPKELSEHQRGDNYNRRYQPLKGQKTSDPTKTTNTIYKDDCFGFISFPVGIGCQDVVFVGIFVFVSLFSDFLTRLGLLPPDPKRPKIVGRRVPGVVAAITLASTSLISSLGVIDNFDIDIPEPSPNARTIEVAICSFSIMTAFLDIRWRDRFDYPEEFL